MEWLRDTCDGESVGRYCAPFTAGTRPNLTGDRKHSTAVTESAAANERGRPITRPLVACTRRLETVLLQARAVCIGSLLSRCAHAVTRADIAC